MYLENNQVKRYPVRLVLAWIAVVIWMAVIFLFSHQTAEESGTLSGHIARLIIQFLNRDAGPGFISMFEAIMRNLAHGLIFFILALLASWAFSETGLSEFKNALVSFLLCALYAASDELHQAFVPGRAGQLTDYLIDLAGVLLAILIYQVIGTIRSVRRELAVQREEEPRK